MEAAFLTPLYPRGILPLTIRIPDGFFAIDLDMECVMGIVERKRWQVAPPAPPSFFEQLSPLNPLVAQVLYNRGITNPETVAMFVNGILSMNNPFNLTGVDVAVPLIRQAVARRLPVVVYGDYDVDGVTACAVWVQVLHALGATVLTYIPKRDDEGYGLNKEAITSLYEEGVRVLITVDCGIRSLEEVALARQLGMIVIVTDHHHVGEALPVAHAVINPRQPGCRYPFKDLAGVGVAYKLAQALLRANHQVPLPHSRRDIDEKNLLDLVALGTVADMVPLLGENHVLVAQGLAQINAARRPGLSALMSVTGTDPGKITTNTISFAMAPRLNAAGRISEAMTALDLLLAPDMTVALPLAQELDALNAERRTMTLEVQDRARRMVLDAETIPPLLFAASDDFPHGVVGLAASRLLDDFYRPSVVVAIEGEFSKGSARSIPEFHITQALDTMPDLLVRYGGHAAAAGFTVRTELLSEFKGRLVALAQKQLVGLMLKPSLSIDIDAPLQMLSWDLFNEMEKLQPFGYGNPLPVFVSRRVSVRSARAVGADGRHLKLIVADEQGKQWDAIAFRQGDWIGRLPAYIDLVYTLEANEWNGRVTLQLNVQDIHFADSSS